MCGSFTCSKNTLVGLNVIYILVSFLMIGVAVHGKVSGIVTSLPIVGGITASGVFLLFISVVGLIGAMKHHQVMLFFYMVVLFFVFIIQFSCSCAALSVNVADQQRIISTAWYASESYSPELVIKAEQTFDCCGSGIEKVNRTTYDKPTMKDHRWSIEHNVFKEGDACYTATANGTVLDTCLTCYKKIQPKVQSGFNAAGGLGLFFSFPELFGALVACRYRNLMDPFGAAGVGLAK